jgi:hypothetical protein
MKHDDGSWLMSLVGIGFIIAIAVGLYSCLYFAMMGIISQPAPVTSISLCEEPVDYGWSQISLGRCAVNDNLGVTITIPTSAPAESRQVNPNCPYLPSYCHSALWYVKP